MHLNSLSSSASLKLNRSHQLIPHSHHVRLVGCIFVAEDRLGRFLWFCHLKFDKVVGVKMLSIGVFKKRN